MKKIALLSTLAILLPYTAHAAYYVYSPRVEKGILEIESKNAFDFNDHGDDERQHKLAVGYGVTNWWALELYGEWEKESRHGYDYTATEIENIFQFTDPGEYWLDVGAKLEYEFNDEPNSPDKVEAGLLLEKRYTDFTHTANFVVVQEVGENANNNPEWEVAWRSLYMYQPMLNPGFEYYGEFGEVAHSGSFDEQSHHLGPVIAGTIYPGLKYDLGLLFGLSDSASDKAVKFNLEYEFPI
jgi:hypothetical protein